MDERASSMLGSGNSILNQGEATQRTIHDNIGIIKKGYKTLNTTNISDRTSGKEEDLGLGAKDVFTSVGDIRRLGDSVGRAGVAYRTAGQGDAARAIVDAGHDAYQTGAFTSIAERAPSKMGTLGTFLSPSFQGSEAMGAGSKVASRVGEIGAAGEATEDAASGLPRVIQRVAEVGGEASKSAAAIGDVVGHGLGIAMAGVGIAKDVAGGWTGMDPDAKASNVLGIAGGIADAISMAIPIFTPLAIGLNIASGIEGYEGDQNRPNWEKTKKGGLDDQQKADVASQQAEARQAAPTSITSTGQVAMKTASVTPQQGGVSVF